MSIEDQLYKFISFYKLLPDWTKKIITAPFQLLSRRLFLGLSYTKFYNEGKLFEDIELKNYFSVVDGIISLEGNDTVAGSP
ncbi:MAG: hypothetical protein RDU14_15315 [Melioribacteraceae bacterium]|nr:hypothetical protein [Melioribacteraceae bacterium]